MNGQPFEINHDPYRRCEETCNHDLARGVLVSELLGGEGPHPDAHLIVNFSLHRARVAPTMVETPVAAAG